jgi:cytochrome c-type biogenesis protein CcmH
MKWRATIGALPLALGLVIAAAAVAPAALAAAPAAVDAHGQLQDPALQARFEQITKELRCLVCQNESIADSNAELAGDLRQQVQELLVAGKSDDAIFDFMTQRYGEFVRFSPPLTAKSVFIWGAPFLMLLLGGVIIYRVARSRGAMPLDDEIAAGPDLK